MATITVTRPLPVRIASAATLAVITGWAALNRDLSDIGVLAYPAIIALQTAREWLWRLEVSTKGIYEKQGIGAPRTFEWSKVESMVMPDVAWWRINPIMRIKEAPNVQLTAAPEVTEVIQLARQKRKAIEGDPGSVSLGRTLVPWIIILALACVLSAAEVTGAA